MENEIMEVTKTNVTLDIVKEAALKGAVSAIVSVIVTEVAVSLIKKSVQKFRKTEAK